MGFDDWFTARFGPPPSPYTIGFLLQDVQDAETRLAICNMKYAQMEHYQMQRTAAKEAWDASTSTVEVSLG